MLAFLLYSLLRALLDVLATSRSDQAQLHAEVRAAAPGSGSGAPDPASARTRGDRMLIAALRDHLPKSAWAGLLVRPETVLGWHRALVRRNWAAYLRRPQLSI